MHSSAKGQCSAAYVKDLAPNHIVHELLLGDRKGSNVLVAAQDTPVEADLASQLLLEFAARPQNQI